MNGTQSREFSPDRPLSVEKRWAVFVATFCLLITPFGGLSSVAYGAPAKQLCSTATLKGLGLVPNSGRPPASKELGDLIPVYVSARPKEGNFCAVDLWMVPTAGHWTARYGVLVRADRRVIVHSIQTTLWMAAAPHEWPTSLYKATKLDAEAKQNLVALFCYSGVPTVSTATLYRRLTGQALPPCG